jgi:hypothetical protein
MNSGHPLPVISPIQLIDKNYTSLHVEMPLVSDDSSVISYELQIDNGLGGTFISVAGFVSNSMEREYIIGSLNAGLVYRLRFRVLN